MKIVNEETNLLVSYPEETQENEDIKSKINEDEELKKNVNSAIILFRHQPASQPKSYLVVILIMMMVMTALKI